MVKTLRSVTLGLQYLHSGNHHMPPYKIQLRNYVKIFKPWPPLSKALLSAMGFSFTMHTPSNPHLHCLQQDKQYIANSSKLTYKQFIFQESTRQQLNLCQPFHLVIRSFIQAGILSMLQLYNRYNHDGFMTSTIPSSTELKLITRVSCYY